MYNLITILGATATGKTKVATSLANKISTEIISADSRQVYKNMDIGTGKDISDYSIKGKQIPYHIIDIKKAGDKYNIYEYQQDFLTAFNIITSKNKTPILCGGSGMYLEAALKGYKLVAVPDNIKLRTDLNTKEIDELIKILSSYKKLHNSSDTDNKKRLIRAIEIEEYYKTNSEINFEYPQINSLIIGISLDRDSRRQKITERLKLRFKEGMINEVEELMKQGVDKETLIYYGLEYKFITQYLIGQLSYNEMFKSLEIAIHQFAKRQMTWYRRMEKQGTKIHWIDAKMDIDEKIIIIEKLLKK